MRRLCRHYAAASGGGVHRPERQCGLSRCSLPHSPDACAHQAKIAGIACIWATAAGGWHARTGGLTEQSWQEGLAELETLLARSRAEWKIVIGVPLAAAVCAAQWRPPLLCQPCCLPIFCDCLFACTGSRQQLQHLGLPCMYVAGTDLSFSARKKMVSVPHAPLSAPRSSPMRQAAASC